MNQVYEGVEAKNKGNNVLQHFPDSPHGWMAARGDVSCSHKWAATPLTPA